MWSKIGKNWAKTAPKVVTVTQYSPPSLAPNRQDSGIGSAQVKKTEEIRKHDKVAEILNKVRHRDGLPRLPSHMEHLVGQVSSSNIQKDMPGLDLGDKTQLVLKSGHPVRHVLEREILNNTRQSITYYDWLMLFGRGIQISQHPKYEEVLNSICRGADSGMFSSEIHRTIVDFPEGYKPNNTLTKYALGNKYATLVGDYFAIRCIHFVEKSKNSKAFIAITKGLEEFTTANFAVKFYDPLMIYPIMPSKCASLNEWIRYNRKFSGYFTGGLYAALVINYNGLPKNEKMLNGMKKFSSKLAVFLRGISDIEMIEHAHEFSEVPIAILTSLPALLYQQKRPTAFDSLRSQSINFQGDYEKILEDIESSEAFHESKYIVGQLAAETKESLQEIIVDKFYGDVIHELIDAMYLN